MIKILGKQRVILLVALALINGLLAAGLYLYLAPSYEQKVRQLQADQSNIKTKQADIDRMQMEFEQLEQQREEFEKLKKRGFFHNQDRREAELVLNKIQKQSDVISAAAKISPGVIEENEEAKKADHDLLVSNISIDIKALDDIDVYKYIYLLNNFFPGHVTIKTMSMERKAQIDGTILRSIASNGNPELVAAKIEGQWRTMVPHKEPDPNAAMGGAP